jgi:hypothetical protein
MMLPMEGETEDFTRGAFQDPACLRPFLNQLQDTPTIQASEFNRFTVALFMCESGFLALNMGSAISSRRTAFLNGSQPIAGFGLLLH